MQNDFEEAHLRSYPELRRIKEGLLDQGARLARMSGSGPTVFGIYTDTPDATTEGRFDAHGWQTAIVRPVILPARLP